MGLAGLSKGVPVRASDLMGSSLPLWPSSLAFEVFARAGVRKSGVLDRTTLPVPFAPLQSVITRSCLAENMLDQASSLAVSPPSASSWWRAATHPGDTNSRVSVPPQRFSRSRGLHPPVACRPCFMPVPPVGFPFRADFHSQSSAPSRASVPSCGWSGDLRFKALLPASVLDPCVHRCTLGQRPSWAFAP